MCFLAHITSVYSIAMPVDRNTLCMYVCMYVLMYSY